MNRYFYIDRQGAQKGTFTPEELRMEGLKKDTLVWTQGMGEWKRAEEIAELAFLFADSVSQVSPPPVYSGASYANGQQPQEPMPKNWMVETILATVLPFLFCSNIFSLLGIIGIVSASQVESYYLRGNYQAAQEASQKAKRWGYRFGLPLFGLCSGLLVSFCFSLLSARCPIFKISSVPALTRFNCP